MRSTRFKIQKLSITDVNYLFGNPYLPPVKAWDDDDDDDAIPRRLDRSRCNDWLNLIIVFVVIDWDISRKDIGFNIGIYADACGMLLL